jgi:hypothetical protein
LAGLRTDAPQRPTIGGVPAGDLGLVQRVLILAA